MDARIRLLCLVCLTITLPPSLSPPAHRDQAPSQPSRLFHACRGAKELILPCPLRRTLPGLPLPLGVMPKLPTSMENPSRQLRPPGQPRPLPGLTPPSAPGSPPLILAHTISCLELHPPWPQVAVKHLSPLQDAAQGLLWAAFLGSAGLPCVMVLPSTQYPPVLGLRNIVNMPVWTILSNR